MLQTDDITFRVRPALKARLKMFAVKREQTLGALVKMILVDWMNTQDIEERDRKVTHHIGAGK